MFEELGLNVARQADNGANPRPDNRSGWLDGETPATPMDELIDHQDEANFWDPSTQLRVIKKAKKPPPYPTPDRGDDRRRGAAGGAPRPRAPPAAAPGRAARRARGCCSTAARCCCSARTTTSASPTTRRCASAAAEAAMRWGAGAGASRLISGNMEPHRQLEERLAEFKGYEAALLFGSGYLANTGTIAALAGRGEVVFSDELNHASIVDGCRLSRAETFVYRHGDLEHLAWGLREAGGRGSLIVTDGVFSMDGDVAPLPELLELARRHGCRLMVDEAHATGALGPGGRGSVAAAGLSGEVDVVVGTLGKALGSYGAYVCASAETDRLPAQHRPPLHLLDRAAAARGRRRALAALELLVATRSGSSGCRRTRRPCAPRSPPRASTPAAPQTQIVPVEVGDAEPTMELCERVLERGVFAQGIRPPTVPEGSSRLRFTVMATHRAGELERAAKLVGGAARELGLARGAAAPASRRLSRCGASSSPAPAPRSARPSSPPSIARTLAARRQAGRRLQARRHRPRRAGRGRPRAAAPRRRLRRRATRRSRPTATGRRPRRTWPRRWPARRSSRSGCSPPRAPRPPAPTRWSARASAGCWSRSAPSSYLVRDLAVDLGLPAGDRRRARARHDQPHPADDRGGPRRRPRGRRRSSSPPGPRSRSAIEHSNRETIAALGGSRSRPCPRSTSPTPRAGRPLRRSTRHSQAIRLAVTITSRLEPVSSTSKPASPAIAAAASGSAGGFFASSSARATSPRTAFAMWETGLRLPPLSLKARTASSVARFGFQAAA